MVVALLSVCKLCQPPFTIYWQDLQNSCKFCKLWIISIHMSEEDKKYLEEKHNKGLIVNDDDHDWGGCPSTYEEQTDK